MHLEVFEDSTRRISPPNGTGFHYKVSDHSPYPSAYVGTFTWPRTHILTLTEYYVKTRKHQTDYLLVVVLFLKRLHQIAGIFLTQHKKSFFKATTSLTQGPFITSTHKAQLFCSLQARPFLYSIICPIYCHFLNQN